MKKRQASTGGLSTWHLYKVLDGCEGDGHAKKIKNNVLYLGAQAYSTLEQLTEPWNQLSQHRNIKVLQTLSMQTHKTDHFKTFFFMTFMTFKVKKLFFFFFTILMVSIIGEDLAALSLAASMAVWSVKQHNTTIHDDVEPNVIKFTGLGLRTWVPFLALWLWGWGSWGPEAPGCWGPPTGLG